MESKEQERVEEQQNSDREEIFEKKDIIYNDNLCGLLYFKYSYPFYNFPHPSITFLGDIKS